MFDKCSWVGYQGSALPRIPAVGRPAGEYDIAVLVERLMSGSIRTPMRRRYDVKEMSSTKTPALKKPEGRDAGTA